MGSVDLLEQKQYMIDGILGWKAKGFSRILSSIVGSGDKPGIDETEGTSEDER